MADNERLGASFSIDVTQLKAGIAQANRLIRESESEFKAAAAGMDKYSESQEIAEAKIKSLNQITAIQQKKVDALQKEYDNLIADGLDPTSAAAIKLRTQINNEQAALNKNLKEIKNQEKALSDMKDSTNENRTAVEKLRDTIDGQTNDLKELQEQYRSTVLEQGKDSDAAKELKRNIESLNDSLNNNKKKLNDTDIALGNVDTASTEAGDGFTVMKGAAADLVSKGIQAIVSGCKNAVSSLIGLAEETKEFRQDINTLTTAFDSVGFSTDEAIGTWKELYGVFGEDDRAVEAANNISRMAKNQEDLNKWVDITTGIWGTYQDALPVEALAESAGETAKVGKVTGNLADALNWSSEAAKMFADYMAEDVTNAEDAFNEALKDCNTEAERQALITKTLTKLYGGAAKEYKKTAGSIIEQNKATADLTLAQAELGEAVAPVNTEIAKLKTQFAKEFSPVLKKEVIPAMNKFMSEIKNSGILTTLSKAVGFCAENFKLLAGGVTLVVGALSTMKVIATVTTAVQGATGAMGIFNAVMAANPVGAVVTAIAALTGGLLLLSTSLADTDEKTKYLSESQEAAVTAANDAAAAYAATKDEANKLADAQSANIDYTSRLYGELQQLVDENGKVKEGYKDRVKFILGELNSALGTEYTMTGDVVNQYKEMKKSIEQVIETKKAQILLEAYEKSYKSAVENVAKAEQARATQAQALSKAEVGYSEAKSKAEKYYNELAEKGVSGNAILMDRKYQQLQKGVRDTKEALDETKTAYDKSDNDLKGYYADISNYETAATLVTKGETGKAISYLNQLGSGYKTATSTAELSAKDQKKLLEKQKKALEQQVIDTEVNARLMKENYKSGVKGVTEEMVKTAEKQAETAKEEFQKVGGNITKGIGDGAKKEKWTLNSAMEEVISGAVKWAKKVAGIQSPSRLFRKEVGVFLGLGVAAGIDDSTKSVIKSVKRQVKDIESAYNVKSLSTNVSGGFNAKGSTGSGTPEGSKTVNVYQNNTFSQAHSRREIYEAKQKTAAAVRLAAGVI